MAPAYAWHPGSGCLNARWAIPVPLLPDELLSSWLTRAALAQGCDPLVLTGDVWPRWRVWTHDPDRGVPKERLDALSAVSGIPATAFEAATLLPSVVTLFGETVTTKSVWPWILAVGARNRQRHGGLQYCPACMAEDRQPYFRVPWRVAWHAVCSQHGIALQDRCPGCAIPLEPHLLTAVDGNLAICPRCHADLRLAVPVQADPYAVSFQETADSARVDGCGRFGDVRLAAGEWFNLAHHVAGLLRWASEGKSKAVVTMLRTLGVDMERLTPPASGLALELLPPPERAAYLGLAGRILALGPDIFLAAAVDAGLSRQGLKANASVLPSSLNRIAACLPSKPHDRKSSLPCRIKKPRPRPVVLRMWVRLQRKLQAEMT